MNKKRSYKFVNGLFIGSLWQRFARSSITNTSRFLSYFFLNGAVARVQSCCNMQQIEKRKNLKGLKVKTPEMSKYVSRIK